MKKNIGATLALYPCPVIVVGAMVNDKPTWTLVAHAGTVAHSHLMVSLVQAHYINKGIRENGKLSVNIVDESWLKDADRMGTISGNKVDKSEAFAKGTLPIIGVTKTQHVEDAVKAANVTLTAEETAELEKLADSLELNVIRFWEKAMK